MSKLLQTRSAQWPLVGSFTFDIKQGDTLKDINGVVSKVGSPGTPATTQIYDVVLLPKGAHLIGGALVVQIASDDSGAQTIAVGDATTPGRFLAATSIKALGSFPLLLTTPALAGENIRITVVSAGGLATVGK